LVLIMRTSGADSAYVGMPEVQLSSLAPMPATPAVAQLSSSGTRHAQLLQPVTQRKWRGMGEVCLHTADIQGACVAGFGDYDVTDTKFSIRLGPLSCSPPV
jgi:hypothetical protein